MENLDHVKLAYARYLSRKKEEELIKQAFTPWLRTAGKAAINRARDSGMMAWKDLKLPFQMFGKTPDAFIEGMNASRHAHAGGGSIIRGLSTNMGASGRRFDELAQMGDDEFNSLLSKRTAPKFWAGAMNPFNRDLNWLNRLDDTGVEALQKGRSALRAPDTKARLDRERIKFLRATVGKDMDASDFRKYYKRYGRPGEGGWGAQEAGRRAGTVLGGLGVYGAAINAPYTATEWAGGLSAIPGARERAMQGGNDAAADALHKFRSGSFFNRMGQSFRPDGMLEDLYTPENIGRGGVAHHFMYGPGKAEEVRGPGIGGYARELLFPLIPGLGNVGSLDQSVQSGALKQFQKMGSSRSNSNMTAVEQLKFIKSANRRFVADLLGDAARRAVTKTRTGPPPIPRRTLKPLPASNPAHPLYDARRMADDAGVIRYPLPKTRLQPPPLPNTPKKLPPPLPTIMPNNTARFADDFVDETPGPWQGAAPYIDDMPSIGATVTPNRAAARMADDFVDETPGPWRGAAPDADDAIAASGAVGAATPAASRWNTFKGLFTNPETRMGAMATAVGTAMLPVSFYAGRRTVGEGSYNAGYGAGSAMAAQQFANMPFYQRMGAAAFPDYAMNRLFQQYPQLMEAYTSRSLPGGMR